MANLCLALKADIQKAAKVACGDSMPTCPTHALTCTHTRASKVCRKLQPAAMHW